MRSYARKQGNARILIGNAKAKQKKQKRIAEKIVYRDKLTVQWTQ